MRLFRTFLSVALVCQLASITSAQLTDGQCLVPLDPSQFTEIIEDDIGLPEAADFAITAPLMATSPIADGVVEPGEYANACFFTYAENENPGQSWPNLDNLNDGDADLTATMHFAHTATTLFIAYEVSDDFLDLDFPANSFQNDGVELFLNPDLDLGDGWGPGKIQLYVDAAGDGDIEFNNRGQAGGLTAVSVYEPGDELFPGEFYTAGLVWDDETGYTVEFQIPLTSLDTEGFAFDESPMTTGDFMLINGAIDDNDEGDDLAGQTGHHLLWHYDGSGSPFGAGEESWGVPLLLGPEVSTGPDGDFNGNGELDAGDLDAMAQYEKDGSDAGDLDGDGDTDQADRVQWIATIQGSYVGDSNFDGEFNSADFITVFGVGRYETGEAAGYAEGDWNGDMLFDSADFVAAFTDGGYEQGPRVATAAVPEPASMSLIVFGLLGLMGIRRR